MNSEYVVTVVDLQSGEETEHRGDGWSERQAISLAEKLAEEYFDGDDVTWFESLGNDQYHVGRIMPDGTRSEPLARIDVHEIEDLD